MPARPDGPIPPPATSGTAAGTASGTAPQFSHTAFGRVLDSIAQGVDCLDAQSCYTNCNAEKFSRPRAGARIEVGSSQADGAPINYVRDNGLSFDPRFTHKLFGFFQRLHAEDETRFIPVVVLTSSREEQDLVKSYELVVNSYIVKPVDFENFSAAVAEAGHYWQLINEEPK